MKTVNIGNSAYPDLLKEIKSRPDKLYYKGNWSREIFKNCLAVVGSRQITTYGRQITNKLVPEIASAGITIVSGFMYGVDAQAHRAALLGGGKTIAVMPCGIDRIHPGYQDKLYNQILEEGGLIISETKGKTMPALWSYPRRNRIVAGLSQATLVVEAGLESGSLITANLTNKFRRKLFAIPGPLTSSVSKGTLGLIKDGAEMVTSADDILNYYNLGNKRGLEIDSLFLNLDREEKEIIEKLKQEPMDIDFLSRQLNKTSSQVGTKLSLMHLKGLVNQEAGKYYVDSL
ncbi:MAG: DNA-processing protein DprA [Candidatus Omnitrophica bacterium]|nr:DNA-processing protein DprA [Candidatus Omnitrophota bacterium]MCF7892218.1 DNA-processing protein DprA [Candidatus Omnitrophota bacterium]MCF7896155.1 DNA-processing protein DprA [Candidatus Omnitrophota bacterium]